MATQIVEVLDVVKAEVDWAGAIASKRPVRDIPPNFPHAHPTR